MGFYESLLNPEAVPDGDWQLAVERQAQLSLLMDSSDSGRSLPTEPSDDRVKITNLWDGGRVGRHCT